MEVSISCLGRKSCLNQSSPRLIANLYNILISYSCMVVKFLDKLEELFAEREQNRHKLQFSEVGHIPAKQKFGGLRVRNLKVQNKSLLVEQL